MVIPLNIIDDNTDLNSGYSKKTIDGKDYYPCWNIFHTFDDCPEELLTDESLVKLRELIIEVMYPAAQQHSLAVDYLWDRKKKEFIPFKKYRVGLGITETREGKKVLVLNLECYKTRFTYRSMNHIRRYRTLAKERMTIFAEAVLVFHNKACSLIFNFAETTGPE